MASMGIPEAKKKRHSEKGTESVPLDTVDKEGPVPEVAIFEYAFQLGIQIAMETLTE